MSSLNDADVLSGVALELYAELDRFFLRNAIEHFKASDYLFPALIPLTEIAKTHYLQSFPHLATFPVSFDPDPPNLKQFAARQPLVSSGELAPPKLSPVRHILTPAACYHFYFRLQNSALERAQYLTTRAQCFRREAADIPLERQPGFTMREIVCVGSYEEVQGFLARSKEWATDLFRRLGMPIQWKTADDPFFDASSNRRWLFGKLQQTKVEMVFEDRLALGSLNNHLNYFGETFDIRFGGKAAFSACMAFGIERWVTAFLKHFGRDKKRWPTLAA